MKPERYEEVDRLFQAAAELEGEGRAAFLDRACAGDAALRGEVEALLAADDGAHSFMAAPALEETPEGLTADQATTLVGEAIGPFRVVARLGAGGMGEVYLAQDARLGRQVALKVLNRSLLADGPARARFLREARLASALDHPNICTIHEIGEAAGRLYIAMQYVEGQTLKRVIGGRPIRLDSLLSIGLQVGEGLAAAHACGIIHRDIKASNIMVTPRGQAKVLDFGLARPAAPEAGREVELTRSGAVMGTPTYMSPEQARGERADQRSDIFSFGVVLYEMATGGTPFRGKSTAETLNAVINLPHTPVEEINKDVPPELAAVIDRALAKAPGERYQSIEAMTGDLRQVVQAIGLIGSHASDLVTVPYVPPEPTQPGLLKRWTRSSARRPTLAVVVGALLVGLTLAVYYVWSRQSTLTVPPTAIKSIAVLPFTPLVAEGRDESLEMGMADTLIARLSNLREISVRPISAVRKYAGIERDAVAAGREQRVDAVLEGNLQRSGERLRVTVRLLHIRDGSSLWAAQFDEKFTNIFAVQDSISERVAGALALQLTGQEKERLKKPYTEDPEAYELYLKGRYHLNRLADDGFLKSLEYFQQAVERDADFALAHAGVAESYNALGGFNVRRPKEVYPQARSAALLALKLDDRLAQAHTALALVKLAYDWDWPGAEREFKRAIEINPGDADAHFQYSYYLAFMGQFDAAVAAMRRAQELDPVSPVKITGMGQVLLMARRNDEAIEQCRKALELEPNLGFAHWLLGLAYMQKGLYESAILALQKSIPLSGDSPDEPGSLGLAYALSGRRAEARKILEELKQRSERQYLSPIVIVSLYAVLGDNDQAFAWLDKAYDERDSMLVLLKVEPMFDPLRSDPRFTDLLRRVGFSQ